MYSVHYDTGSACQRSDPGFNNCVAEKLNDMRVNVAKGILHFTYVSGTKIGSWNWSLIYFSHPTALLCAFRLFAIKYQRFRTMLLVVVVMTIWQHLVNLQVAYFHASFFSQGCLRLTKIMNVESVESLDSKVLSLCCLR